MKIGKGGRRSACLVAFAAALLAGCGGGSQIEPFVPTRVIAFGDETSLLEADGRKYGINALAFDTAVPPAPIPGQLVCTNNQIWVQQVAYSFGHAFPGCPGTGTLNTGEMLAQAEARTTDLTAQVDAFVGGGAFGSRDLVTVAVGVYDVVDALSAPNPAAAAEAAGARLGGEVVRMTRAGAKVLVATIPDLGLSPYAAARPGSAAQLSDLSNRFNTQLRLRLLDVPDGGRSAALVRLNEVVLTMTRETPTYGLINLSDPACSVGAPLTNCDQTTLVEGARPSFGNAYLWAGELHLGPGAQYHFGLLAVRRAHDNPF